MADKWERKFVVRLLSDGHVVSVDGVSPDITWWIEYYDRLLGEQGWELVSAIGTTVDGAKAVEHIYQRKVGWGKTS